MRQIRILKNYNGALGRYFRGICLLSSDTTAFQLVQDGYAEYADPEPSTPPAPLPQEREEEEAAETATAPQGENAMKPKAGNGKRG